MNKVALAAGLLVSALASAQDQQPKQAWPRPIPARSVEPDGDELFIMTLGDVSTPLADATFDPAADTMTPRNGNLQGAWYQQRLGIKHFAPIDKSRFPLPPSGWCSWYYYYQEVTPQEVLLNARWMKRNLLEYGATVCQIDDGWQGTGHGLGENRDWTTIDERFRDPGMGALAQEIAKLGLTPGLWLAPHGQSNEKVAKDSGAFLLTPDGKTISNTWEGTFLVDPTAKGADAYLSDLFGRLKSEGYTYFKIDGQPIVIDEYQKHLPQMASMRGVIADFDSKDRGRTKAEELYRHTLRIIRGAIGEDSYLLGCWGIPLAGAGIMNGSRTGGDIVPGWEGFLVAADAVQRWNFLHNIAWYCDPDVVLVRPPLSEGTARAWATIQGLTGQALMDSDRLPDLPPSRVEMLKRIYPATDIRPLDLFVPRKLRKPVWDLKVSHLGRSYDVVGVFNFGSTGPESRLVSWAELGLDPSKRHHVFDFWQGTYLGSWEDGVFITVPERDVRVLTVMEEDARPALLSTSRHITQGPVDLVSLDRTDAPIPVIKGRSRLIGGDPYVLTFAMPRDSKLSSSAALVFRDDNDERKRVRIRHEAHQGYSTVTLDSPVTQEVSWQVSFNESQAYTYPVEPPPGLRVTPVGLEGAEVTWGAEYHGNAGHRVVLDGKPVGVSFDQRARLRGIEPGKEHTVEVFGLWYDGAVSKKPAAAKFTIAVPDVLALSSLEPRSSEQAWGSLGKDRTCEGRPLAVGGKVYESGLGTHARSVVSYRLPPGFKTFTAMAALDDEAKPPTPNRAVFEVWCDGQKRWASEPLAHGAAPVPVSMDLAGARTLELRVLPAGETIDYLHADWLGARVEK